MLLDAAEWLARKRRRMAGLPAIYSRGSDAVQLTAAPGRTKYETVDQEGATVAASQDDWLVTAAELVLAGVRTEPNRGDTIEVTRRDGSQQTYEVMPITDGGECFSLDPHRVTYRIHSRLTTEA